MYLFQLKGWAQQAADWRQNFKKSVHPFFRTKVNRNLLRNRQNHIAMSRPRLSRTTVLSSRSAAPSNTLRPVQAAAQASIKSSRPARQRRTARRRFRRWRSICGPRPRLAASTGIGSTQLVSRCGIGVRGHGEEEPFSLWFCPVRKLMLSAGPLLFTPRLPESWPPRSAPPSARAHAAQFRAN